jgi:cytochrome c oxidase subunit I+III
MPRRIYTYSDASFVTLNQVASVGAFVFAFAQFFFVGNLIWTLRSGPVAPPNPWGASTLEWLGKGIIGGSTPRVGGTHSTTAGGGHAELGANSESGHVGEHTSMRPLELSLGMAVTFFGLALFNGYSAGLPITLIGCLIAGYSLWGWAKDDLRERFSVGLDELIAERWPFQELKKLQLGMWVFLSTEVIVFGSIIGSYLFIRINSTVWPAPGSVHDITTGLLNTVVLLTSSLTVVLAVGAAREGKLRPTVIWLTVTLILGSLFMAVKATEWYAYFTGNYGPHPPAQPFTFSSQLPGSTYFFTTGLHGAHVVAGLLITVYLIKKATSGGYSAKNHLGIENFGLYWHFVDILWVFLFPLFYLI